MPNHYLEPANDHVLVVDMPQETTLDGIDLPPNERQKDMLLGTVIYSGPLATETKPEDRIYYGPYAGKIIIFEGIAFRILRQGQIELYVRKSQ